MCEQFTAEDNNLRAVFLRNFNGVNGRSAQREARGELGV